VQIVFFTKLTSVPNRTSNIVDVGLS